MLAIAQAVAINIDERFALLAIPALHPRPESVAPLRIRDVKLRVRIAGNAQSDLDNHQAETDAAQQQNQSCTALRTPGDFRFAFF